MESRGLEALDNDVALLVTSWLSSFVTTHLRAASCACRKSFSRNCAATTTTTSDYLFLEQAAPPNLPGSWSLVEQPHLNPLSPLRCWRMNAVHAVPLRISHPRLWRKLSNDRAVVLTAVAQAGHALKIADPSLCSDREVVLAAVAQNGYALKIADPSLKSDREIVLTAVAQVGYALQFADPSLKSDRACLACADRWFVKVDRRLV